MPSFPPDAKSLKKYNSTKWTNVSDREVFVYSELISKALRSKADFFRYVRKSTTTIGVLAAGFGTGIHGAFKADADTLTMVSGVATMMPLLQHVWKAGEASKAQEKGIRLIGKARAKFMKSVGGNTGLVDSTKITANGATLFDEVNAALIVVSDAVAQTIPSLDDLKTAMGEVENELKMTAFPGTVKIPYPPSTNAIIKVVNDRAVLAISDNAGVVKIKGTDISSFQNKITLDMINIESVGTGTATISLFNAHGGIADINVKVGNRRPKAYAGYYSPVKFNSKNPIKLNGNGSSDPDGDQLYYNWTITDSSGNKVRLIDASSSNPNPSFQAIAAGTFTIELIVNDGVVDSVKDSTTIIVN